MKIVVDSKIIIYDPPFVMVAAMKKALSLRNPVYDTLARRVKYGNQSMKCLYAVKQFFQYFKYDKQRNIFECGRGNLGKLINYLDKTGLKAEFTYDFVDKKLSKELRFNGKLRDYQEGVVDKVVDSGDKCGVIKLGTGFGKTIMALEIIRKLQLTALIIVPRVSILNQFKQELKKYYDYEAGIIQGKTWDIKEITIASMATLRRQNNSRILQKRFSVVFSDEVHTNISDKGISVIQSFNPKFLYGLTATARRTDEQSEAIFFTFGNIIIDRVLPQKAPKVQVVKSNANIEVSIDYHEMILDQTENEERNKLIVKLSMEELKTNRKILILTKRIEHYKKISGFFDDKVKVFEVSSDTKQSERDELLTKLRNNEIDYDVILGTYSMLSTGVDCPSLDTLIFAGDIKSDVLAEQSIGRILRLFEGKSDPKIIDIDDNLNPMLHRQFLERRKFYNKNNWQIIN